jgi:hypothetical protein
LVPNPRDLRLARKQQNLKNPGEFGYQTEHKKHYRTLQIGFWTGLLCRDTLKPLLFGPSSSIVSRQNFSRPGLDIRHARNLIRTPRHDPICGHTSQHDLHELGTCPIIRPIAIGTFRRSVQIKRRENSGQIGIQKFPPERGFSIKQT